MRIHTFDVAGTRATWTRTVTSRGTCSSIVGERILTEGALRLLFQFSHAGGIATTAATIPPTMVTIAPILANLRFWGDSHPLRSKVAWCSDVLYWTGPSSPASYSPLTPTCTPTLQDNTKRPARRSNRRASESLRWHTVRLTTRPRAIDTRPQSESVACSFPAAWVGRAMTCRSAEPFVTADARARPLRHGPSADRTPAAR
jgi:hypothetical protein